MLNPEYVCFKYENSVDLDQLALKPADQDLDCFHSACKYTVESCKLFWIPVGMDRVHIAHKKYPASEGLTINLTINICMGLHARKPVFGVCEQ